jgi:hypothetical protein
VTAYREGGLEICWSKVVTFNEIKSVSELRRRWYLKHILLGIEQPLKKQIAKKVSTGIKMIHKKNMLTSWFI